MPQIPAADARCDRSPAKTPAAGPQDAFTACEYSQRGRGDSDNTPYAAGKEATDLAALTGTADGPAFAYTLPLTG